MKKERGSTCETRFRHKLNMLEPGIKMLKWIAVLAAVGMLLLFLKLKTAAYIGLGLSGLLAAVLIVLLTVEAHQDKVLSEIAQRESTEEEKN